ncbi:hypothetical protein I8752_27725 [Nostocaceae cyanobacterium CENA369]|uniref:Uncharacterized protein n=1 Tax=Dendronalium phyllosphericum CENA369 TaxID=1725256 RepID=A0A8J7LG72_9NOST|nr:hypothetical protein [Dendronalium phyllosphericum]MBH8576712.1 hypothetical protein [Dendronalium phyllosphericum CENA369]
MSNITVFELNNAGIQLFEDSESFLNDLSDIDSGSVNGGGSNAGGGAGGGAGFGGDISNPTALTKLAEAFVTVYGIGHIAYIAKSFSGVQ